MSKEGRLQRPTDGGSSSHFTHHYISNFWAVRTHSGPVAGSTVVLAQGGLELREKHGHQMFAYQY